MTTLIKQPTRLVVTKRLEDSYALARPAAQLILIYACRQKSRQRVTQDTGEEVGLLLPGETILHNGDLLEADNGLIIAVKAADEELSAAFTTSPLLLLRACYQLGNRHVPIQITESRVSYLHDDELDEMLRKIGLEVVNYTGPFEPETGASHAHNGGKHCS